ncbi:MAG: Crp/Fnr family transcriptional regulator [Ghiorsea sp.]|nr:Crp/Fnr family transcriptional regulator [Ghiorsea sp.]
MNSIKLNQGFSLEDFPKAKAVLIKKGDLLLYEGDEQAKRAFIIVSGKLEVRLISGTGHETLLYHLNPGELVGELAAFGIKARTATIAATMNTQLLEVPYTELVKRMSDSSFVEKISHHFLTRYLRTHDVVSRLGQPNVAMKLCRYFKSLSDQKDMLGDVVTLKIPSHSEMGKLLSCQRETITREMKKLVLSGVIIPQEKAGLFELDIEKNNLLLAGMLDAD